MRLDTLSHKGEVGKHKTKDLLMLVHVCVFKKIKLKHKMKAKLNWWRNRKHPLSDALIYPQNTVQELCLLRTSCFTLYISDLLYVCFLSLIDSLKTEVGINTGRKILVDILI